MKKVEVLPKDSIPSIDSPSFSRDYFGDEEDMMIVLEGENVKAYPFRIFGGHEIVNDEFEGRPLAVTWCPICHSASVYSREVKGKILTFGVSGKLADDALVMYDRETGSEWKQTSGECIEGEFEGEELKLHSSTVMSYRDLKKNFEDFFILQPEKYTEAPDSVLRDQVYSMEGYEQYFEKEEFGLYCMRGQGEKRSWDRKDIESKESVLGLEINDEKKAYPKSVLKEEKVIHDTLGDQNIVVFYDEGLYAYRSDLDFSFKEGSFLADGTIWDPVTGESDDGRRLEKLNYRLMFAFAWQDIHGEESFYLG